MLLYFVAYTVISTKNMSANNGNFFRKGSVIYLYLYKLLDTCVRARAIATSHIYIVALFRRGADATAVG